MTRSKPSALDLALVDAVGKLGFTISPTQLERWRTQRWLRRPADWTDSATGKIRDKIVHRAACLAHVSTSGRSISWIGWTFWAIDDTPETASRLRAAVVEALERPLRRAGLDIRTIPEGDSYDAFAARQDMAAGMLKNRRRCPERDFDGSLRAGAAEAEFDLPPSRTVANMFHKALMDPGARMVVGGVADVTFEELMDAWESASPDNAELVDRMRTAHCEAALTGVDIFAHSPMAGGMRGLVRAVQEADDQRLCAAVRACTKGSGILGILLIQRVPHEPEILRTLMADEMWEQWVRVGGFVPVLGMGGEAAIAVSVVQHLLIPGWAEGLARYQTLMETLLGQTADR
ncbi:hypothetical protein R3L02_41960 [Streptomyces scabiei]|uniref:hypothetical protein n=1 Tax=Streptomyces scabiei TaxID=1930 RepID=UPI00298F2C7A|nr:hypothetical protein [Streptomyces scabiei]MDW8478317.1 hypothetical protein [Streptomyces scabiei]